MFAIFSGLRQGEILAAKWKNLDWEEGTYTVRENLTRLRKFDPTTKTEASLATVELPPIVMEALRAHKIRQGPLRWKKRWKDYDLIFCTIYGGPQTHTYVDDKWFKQILKDAGIRDVPFHTLRKISGSVLLQESGDLKEVQTHLRHARIEITANVYATVYKGKRRESLTRIQEKIAI